ncbi:MAG: helix-turn-helix domain-containing protein [Oscillospiraceae bacterium]|nr:helix-turn-helix domain-containing protein [Oscillospiraceae bacterium]
MKNYQFGNHICELRRKAGFSQFQLGRLVGVSDKAVSKWENGDAKPRIDTCYRLAEVLGVSLRELLASGTTLAKSKLDKLKMQQWKEAQKRLSLFGDVPPVLCRCRFEAEKAALAETDAILSLTLLAQITKEANRRNTVVLDIGQTASSFVAWLLSASAVNPLPPHYRCPNCGTTEFISSVRDGFDLTFKRCSCGTEMVHDGHNLPHCVYTRSAQRNAGIRCRLAPSFLPVAAQMVRDFYQGNATILPVKISDYNQDALRAAEIYVVMTGRDDLPPLYNGFWHTDSASFWDWWREETIYEFIPDKQLGALSFPQGHLPDPIKQLTPETAEALYQKRCMDPKHFAASIAQQSATFPHTFHLLMQLDGFSYSSGLWADPYEIRSKEIQHCNRKILVEEGQADFLDIPAFCEDVWNDIRTALSNNGIYYDELAFEVMENARKGIYCFSGMPDELSGMLHALSLPGWYPEYLGKVRYLSSKGVCISKLLLDIIFLELSQHEKASTRPSYT